MGACIDKRKLKDWIQGIIKENNEFLEIDRDNEQAFIENETLEYLLLKIFEGSFD